MPKLLIKGSHLVQEECCYLVDKEDSHLAQLQLIESNFYYILPLPHIAYACLENPNF